MFFPLVGYITALLLCLTGNRAQAQSVPEMYRLDFESGGVLGQLETRLLTESVVSHQVTGEDRHTGEHCECLLFRSSQISDEFERVVIPVPASRVFGELSVALWVRANCANVRLGVRIRFPHQIDPRTGQPLAVELEGTAYSYSDVAKWQRLTCSTTDEAIQSRLIRVRNQLSTGINPVRVDEREPYVDQVLILLQLPQGQSALEYDDLEFGPVVRPATLVPQSAASSPAPLSKMTIVDDRVRKEGRPFFPIFTIYHGESLDLIARTGVNLLWVKSYEDRPLLHALAEMDVGAIATPPQPSPEQAILDRAGIPSLPDWTTPIWAWILGIEIPPEDRAYVTAWADQVRDADRQLRRPILADVAGEERDFHRHLDLMASSRFGIHTALSNEDHFEELRGRRDFALPGKPMFAFLQTEASGPLLDQRLPGEAIPIVEPEQILHQGYEAIAAGFKGVGFWKQIPLDSDVPGLQERLQAIRIFAIHGGILEPFLATGRVVDEIPVLTQDSPPPPRNNQSSPLSSRWDRRVTPAGHIESTPGRASQIRSTVFQTDYGLLVLLVWHEPGAQCVPGEQTAKSVRLLIRGSGEVAQAWEVTPTSVSQSNLSMERIAGGTEITLKEFDQYAAIVVTSSPTAAEALRRKARQHRRTAAEAYVLLAEQKLARVSAIHEELVAVAPAVPQGEAILRRASFFVDQARQELAVDHADEARLSSQRALQQLRTLQRKHWDAAVDPLTCPTSSLDATGFQTLPDHWRLLSQLGKATSISPNRLPSGSFDGEDQLIQAGWCDGSEGKRFISLRCAGGGANDGTHLSMIVKPDAPSGEAAVLISPEIPVEAGELVLVTGKLSIPRSLSGPDHQFQVFDTIAGRGSALLFKERTDGWASFRLLRRIVQSGTLRLRFELHGPGLVNLDDVRVHVAQLSDHQVGTSQEKQAAAP